MSKTASAIGRLDILAERIIERFARQFEADTGLTGLWDAAAPSVRSWARRTLNPPMPRRMAQKGSR